MKVYIVCYKGTVYGVFDSLEKARAGRNADLYDAVILEEEVL